MFAFATLLLLPHNIISIPQKNGLVKSFLSLFHNFYFFYKKILLSFYNLSIAKPQKICYNTSARKGGTVQCTIKTDDFQAKTSDPIRNRTDVCERKVQQRRKIGSARTCGAKQQIGNINANPVSPKLVTKATNDTREWFERFDSGTQKSRCKKLIRSPRHSPFTNIEANRNPRYSRSRNEEKCVLRVVKKKCER